MKKWFKETAGVLILTALALLGVVLGCLAVGSADEKTLSLLSQLTGGFLQNSGAVAPAEHFFSSVGSDMLLLFMMFLLGFCAFSQPLIGAVALFCGVGMGVSVTYLYLSYGTGAILYTAVLIAPPAALSTLTLIFAGAQAVKMAGSFYKRAFHLDAPALGREKIYKYSLKFVAFSCILVLSGILDTALSRIFSNLITL